MDTHQHDEEMLAYYQGRASIFDGIYEGSRREGELRELGAHLGGLLAGHDVLEVACGPGYWTRVIAGAARSVLATDAVEAVLAEAAGKSWPEGKVRFGVEDAYQLAGVSGAFTAGFHYQWYSHVPRERIPEFLRVFHGKLAPGALVVMGDSHLGGPDREERLERWRARSFQDEKGNTYSVRKLPDGREFTIMKNLPEEADLKEQLAGFAGNLRYRTFPGYWVMAYDVRGD